MLQCQYTIESYLERKSFLRNSGVPNYNPFTVTPHVSEALLKFYLQDIPPPRAMATVAERLARTPPTRANRVQSPTGSPDFRKWESCRTMPLVGGCSRGSPVSYAPSFRYCSIFTSITLIGSQDLDSLASWADAPESQMFSTLEYPCSDRHYSSATISHKYTRPKKNFTRLAGILNSNAEGYPGSSAVAGFQKIRKQSRVDYACAVQAAGWFASVLWSILRPRPEAQIYTDGNLGRPLQQSFTSALQMGILDAHCRVCQEAVTPVRLVAGRQKKRGMVEGEGGRKRMMKWGNVEVSGNRPTQREGNRGPFIRRAAPSSTNFPPRNNPQPTSGSHKRGGGGTTQQFRGLTHLEPYTKAGLKGLIFLMLKNAVYLKQSSAFEVGEGGSHKGDNDTRDWCPIAPTRKTLN
ncbi:hypothetical protein PR048_029497 [Dryococelus australis]|uniref:Uncharacterized protein n=1 Tax=Dryococelus australis TaxID=614101 RepID=A0ABQ9GDI7_9NEOP|nr:hypothetical protein PR048_029497 [Dryococelus australis]